MFEDTLSIITDSVNTLESKGVYLFSDSLFGGAEPVRKLPGIEGELIGYSLENDIIVTSILFFSFLLLSYVLKKGSRLILHQLKDFFVERERTNMFVETGQEFRYQIFLILNTSIMVGMLFYGLFLQPEKHFLTVSTWIPITLCIGVCLVYFVLKFLLYSFVNWVFFQSSKRSKWIEVYSLIVSILGLVLFPLVSLYIYFDLSDRNTLISLGILLLFCKILLFYKGFCIFFPNFRGLLYNILYLCTLEIIPLIILAKVVSELNEGWTINY